MASGTLGAENSREKHRWGDGNKVYTRKTNKGLKNSGTTADGNSNNINKSNDNAAAAAAVAAATTTTATVAAATAATAAVADADASTTTAAVAVATSASVTVADATTTSVTVADATTATATGADATKTTATVATFDNNVPPQASQVLATEEANLSQRQRQSQLDVASGDSSSHNRPHQEATENDREAPPSGNGVMNVAVKPVVTRVDDRVRISLAAAKSKSDIRELREKLLIELDEVRSLVKKLEAKEIQLTRYNIIGAGGMDNVVLGSGYSNSGFPTNDVIERSSLVITNSDGRSVGHHDSRPFRPLSISVTENSQNLGVGQFVEKEKRTPKANQFYQNSEFLLGKDRLPHPESNKKLKSNGRKKHGHSKYGFGVGVDKYRSQLWKSCGSLLQKLMKHKHGWVFNEPVNAKALGLHDYHLIIKHPMDLGTIKSRLDQSYYKFPREFAEDVRLTFRNAMTYNPKGQDVHIMAEQLSMIFEERWSVIDSEYNPDWRYEMYHEVGLPTPTSRKALHTPPPNFVPQMRTSDRPESMVTPIGSKLKPAHFISVGRTPARKKPKANDPNKRDMTFEEKQRLSTNLQSLPSEKLDNIVQIIKKRNSALNQHQDEIEVDIDSVDAETLWELDRFVTNYKKSLSKNKRKAEMALQARAEAGLLVQAAVMNPTPVVAEAPKESKADEKTTTTTVEGEKQGDNASSSSSSSSDSGSSSSDSDSDSSSGYGSDAGHSPKT